jgi:hypothetical protein
VILSTPLAAPILLACGALLGCSKQPAATLAAATVVSPCDTLAIKAQDVGGLLHAPITRSTAVAGDAQSCAFLTTGFAAITVSVRPGLGRASLDAWVKGKMPLAVRTLGNVGDSAVWQDTLHEAIARQDDLLCDIQVRGGAEDIAVAADSLPEALGALCNRIFAARQVH